MDGTEDQRISFVLSEIRRVQDAISATSDNWDLHISAARSAILVINSTSLMQRPDREADQVFVVSNLQHLAYYDPDAGGIQDIADWCITQWLHLLQRDGESVDALQGLGQGWLSRAQSSLARIHRLEGSSSSASSSHRPGTSHSMTYTSSDEEREAARAAIEADARVHTADYVEARGILLPAIEYFSRAVEIADRRGRLTGSLLASAAEAHMSLGNVSYSYINERYFQQALIFLRRASRLPDYTLSPYLQHYLDEYGRLID